MLIVLFYHDGGIESYYESSVSIDFTTSINKFLSKYVIIENRLIF